MDMSTAADSRALLKRTAVFGHLTPGELDALLHEMAWFGLAAGMPLYRRGDASDALYLLKSGSLGVFGPPLTGGAPRMLGVIAAGATLGEVGLISGGERSHSVWALRDSELLSLSDAGFEDLVSRHPQAMLGAARVAVKRLQRGELQDITSAPRTFAVLPFNRDVGVRTFAEQLRRQLSAWGECVVIDAQLGHDHDSGWFAAREAESKFVLYVDDGDAAWRRLCRRQADASLLLVDAERDPSVWPYPLDDSADDPARPRLPRVEEVRRPPRYLILRHPRGQFVYGAARAWRARLDHGTLPHHHWRHQDDIARLARLLSGHSTGLVLSGGGARGFAHIGAIQALRESGIAIDAVVGTSVGAIIGAGLAYEWSDDKMRTAYRYSMVEAKPLSDWTVPLVALTRGARTTMLLREAVGEIDIGDLPIRFACVSADLTSGTTAIHREGLLWRWLRASSAVPGILPPVFHGGHVYVDGGVINNLPIDVLAEEGHGRIIAVDAGGDDTVTADVDEAVSPPLPTLWTERHTQHRRPSAFAILIRAAMVNSEAANTRRRELADLLLHPDLQMGMFDWREFDRAVQIGYRSTRDALRQATLSNRLETR